MANESKEWRKFLSPMVSGAVALMAAGTLYLQKSNNTDVNARIAKVEVIAENAANRCEKSESRVESLYNSISTIKADVSFIRGKLESLK